MVYTPLCNTAVFTVTHFLLEILRIPGNVRRRNLDNFYFFYFFSRDFRDTTTTVQNSEKRILENSLKVYPPWLGSEENFDF